MAGPGPKGHGQLSMTPRAIKWRQKEAEKNTAWQQENLEPTATVPETDPGDQDHVDGESKIGVFKPTLPPVTEDEPEEVQRYHCVNCLETVDVGVDHCPTCLKPLSWKGLE